MATSHFFGNKIIKLPGAYSMVKSVSPVNFSTASYSKVLIVNTNPNYAFGGSVEGTLTKGGDALYKFKSLPEARAFFKSGYMWSLVENLFRPSRLEGRQGISELQFINALKSTAPSFTLSLSAGTLEIKVKDESANANGVKINTSATVDTPAANLKSGYAMSIEKGVKDPSKYVLKFWQGTYKGEWSDGIAFDGLSPEQSLPELILASPEIASVNEFKAWAIKDETFSAGFEITSASGDFSENDIATNAFVLAAGGSATYAAAQLTAALDLLKKGDWSILLSLNKQGASGADVINASFQHYVQSETRFKKYLAVPGADKFSDNVTAAKAFNSERVWLIHGTPRKASSLSPLGYRVYDSLTQAALVVGRIAGLPPQVPGTFKDIDVAGLENPLTDSQLEEALDAGVLVSNYDDDLGYFCITRAINTLQNNTSLQNPDGSTFSIQISRICTQLNIDVVINAKQQIFSSNETANVNTVSPIYLKNWLKSFLATKIATPQQDNLITGVESVDVERQQDALYANYAFYTNSEIAFLFFTGVSIY